MTPANRAIGAVVQQHAEEAAFLWSHRSNIVASPNHALAQISAHDERISAHIDGLRVADETGWTACELGLATASPGGVFVATAVALDAKRPDRLERLMALAAADPSLARGLVSGFGWTPAVLLQGVVKAMLSAQHAFHRFVGIACCSLHRVDPRQALAAGIQSEDVRLRAEALRGAGRLGRTDLLSSCTSRLEDQHAGCRSNAAYSAILLGDRNKALAAVRQVPLPEVAPNNLRLLLQTLPIAEGHLLLQEVAGNSKVVRLLIEGSGIVGDPTYVPWLLKQMLEPARARLAGEAFSLVTGANLPMSNLDASAPAEFQSGPTDDPDDANVDMDPDEGLPWPDVAKVEKWWGANSHRFQKGVRYFIGAPVTREHCVKVLKTGYQRQRILAAHYLCLLEPGTPLFNTSAPAWRQERLLVRLA